MEVILLNDVEKVGLRGEDAAAETADAEAEPAIEDAVVEAPDDAVPPESPTAEEPEPAG